MCECLDTLQYSVITDNVAVDNLAYGLLEIYPQDTPPKFQEVHMLG